MFEIALFVSFLLEVFAVGAMSYAGFRLPVSMAWRFLLGIVLPVTVIVFWASYMAPKAVHRLKNPYYLLAKGIIYAFSASFLVIIGHTMTAIVFAIITILDEIVLFRIPGQK